MDSRRFRNKQIIPKTVDSNMSMHDSSVKEEVIVFIG